jgi:hypothetical protein
VHELQQEKHCCNPSFSSNPVSAAMLPPTSQIGEPKPLFQYIYVSFSKTILKSLK